MDFKNARHAQESFSLADSVEIITNSPEAKAFLEAMMKELMVPGRARLEQ
jgi:hypothetical protein